MKEKELRESSTCGICNKKIGASGVPLFYRVRIQRYGLKFDALNRQQGLAMMLGGNGFLAGMMGPDEDMAEKISDIEVTVCEDCSTKQTCIAMITEDNEPEYKSKIKKLPGMNEGE